MRSSSPPADPAARTQLVERVQAGYDRLMHLLSEMHSTEFVELDISMPQAKLLYLLASASEVRMSALAARLHVTLSTVSGAVDRLVERGLASRHDDPADRRQVVVTATPEGIALIERFRELNETQLSSLLDALDDRQLAVVADALEVLADAAARSAIATPSVTTSPAAAGAVAAERDRP
jgi:DNA-binding MarR family transcriptional regulator